jgi:hypothetical protein
MPLTLAWFLPECNQVLRQLRKDSQSLKRADAFADKVCQWQSNNQLHRNHFMSWQQSCEK